ncbi:fimbria/pilus outer membrane usher protein [Xanthomonas campestris]|uniref:fimbria/pilus outer membrane usher protein n=1 Tax=Xanthomonas campestris TaxID=339 RepID=UPI001E330296|nr:fimbria/pilus outer membrane usher protein [Xanthomonas campestris]MCC4605475.1 fimbrial biogenesis outer membrane usher protein [Xanthomonas campestris pv. parthenii]
MKLETRRLRQSQIYLALGLLFPLACLGKGNLWFDPAFLSDNAQDVADLSRFARPGAQAPGSYPVDVLLNGEHIASRTINFIALPSNSSNPSSAELDNSDRATAALHDSTGLLACVSIKDLYEMGIRLTANARAAAIGAEGGGCRPLGLLIPQAWTAFDFKRMRLDISIPQVALEHTPSGWVDPGRWDEGINAGLLTYRISGSNSTGAYGSNSNHYLGLESGINIGAWRLRDTRSWTESINTMSSHSAWQRQRTYAQRAIVPWRSELTLGDTVTSGDIFDSLSFSGAMLASDDTMYPYSLRGYAPIVRGVANTNAQVEVRQNGYLIYQTNVSPGAFVINDLTPGALGGDLHVKVTEADGRVRDWIVPYALVPMLQRQGSMRYEISAGQYRSVARNSLHPTLGQGTVMWGLPHNVTAYGGVQYTSRYLATAMGMGLNMGRAGAISVDITRADSRIADDSRHQGWSLRFLYSHTFDSLGSSFQMTGYRYTTAGFYTLDDTTLNQMRGWQAAADSADLDWHDLYRQRRQLLQINLSQRLGTFGDIYLTNSHESYWNSSTSTDSLQIGFSGSYHQSSFTLSYSEMREPHQFATDRELQLTISLPLSFLSSRNDSTQTSHPMYSSLHSSRNDRGDTSWTAGVSGTALKDSSLAWEVSQGHAADGNSGNTSISWLGRYGNVNLGYSYGEGSRQTSYGFSGGVVVHHHGMTFGQPLADTNILVEAPGASGLTLQSNPGVKTDRRGYAVVSSAQPYQENRVALGLGNPSSNVDIVDTIHRVVPTRGALVSTQFVTHTGASALLTLTHAGAPLPFGTSVRIDNSSGIVSDQGEVFLSGLPSTGTLRATWGDAADQQCQAHYSLPVETGDMPILRLKLACDDFPIANPSTAADRRSHDP